MLFLLQEINNEPKERQKPKPDPDITIKYCSNGCQGACACPALNYDQMTLTNNVTSLTLPPLPAPEDFPPSHPLPKIPRSENPSNLRQRTRNKGSALSLKEKVVNRQPADPGNESSKNERKGSEGNKSKGDPPRSSRIAKKQAKERGESTVAERGSEHRELKIVSWVKRGSINKQLSKDRSKIEINKAGADKDSKKEESPKRVNKVKQEDKGESTKQVNKTGSTKTTGNRKSANKEGSSKELNKSQSKKQVNRVERSKGVKKNDETSIDNVSTRQSRRDSLKLLRGMISFRKTSSDGGKSTH